MKSFHHTLLVLLLGAAFALSGFPMAYGQEEEEEKEVFTLEEIVVTATKREENLLEVPLTMTAFDDQLIESLGITNSNDLEQLTPGLQFGDDGEKVGQGTVIRGIGSRLFGETHSDLAVATYVDGVYSYARVGITPSLFDVDRVEVARGPQGTLHGRNSIAGSISFITKKPGGQLDAEILVEFTDQFTQRYNLAFGGPITDQFLFRITGGYFDGDGAQENIGRGGDYDAPNEYFVAPQLRFKTDRLDINLRYAYTEDTGSGATQVLSSDPPRDDATELEGQFKNPWYMYAAQIPSLAKCAPGETGNQCDDLQNKINVNRPSIKDNSRESVTLNADFDIIEGLTLRYTFGWSDIKQLTSADMDATDRVGGFKDTLWYQIDPDDPDTLITDRRLLSADAGVPYDDKRVAWPYFNDQSSHELQLISNFDGPLNFIAGVFFYENSTEWDDRIEDFGGDFRFTNGDDVAVAGSPWELEDEEENPIFIPVTNCQEFVENVVSVAWGMDPEDENEWLNCPPGSDHTVLGYSFSHATSETKAAFVSVDYQINDQWFVSGGLRWTEDEKTQGRSGDQGIGNLGEWDPWTFPDVLFPIEYNSDFSSGVPASWDAYIWNVAVEYTPIEATMIYGRISTGYRAGAFNAISGVEGEKPDIEEETLINYEVGVKGVTLDQRLQLTAAGFFQDFDGYQMNAYQMLPADAIEAFTDWPLEEYTANVDGTTIWGGEVEATYYLGERWRLSGFYAYLGSDLGAYEYLPWDDPDMEVFTWTNPITGVEYDDIPQPRVVSGNELPMQPKHKFALTVAYTMPLLEIGDLQLLSTLSYTGDRHPAISNIPSHEMPSYKRVDVRGTWTSADRHWSATVFVQNLLDEAGLVEYQPVSLRSAGVATAALTEPRRIGLILRWKL